MKHLSIVLFALLLMAVNLNAQQVINPMSDGMVLAKNQPIYVYDNQPFSVEFASHQSRAHKQGEKWVAKLPAMKAGGPYIMTVSTATNTRTINDVYVGSVVMIAGQSNMQFKIQDSSTNPADCPADALLRSYTLPRLEEGEPYGPADGWIVCTSENVKNWSAVGYHVGAEIRKQTGEAVGIINCYQGASTIQAWMPAEIAFRPEFILPQDQLHFDHTYPKYLTWNQHGTLFNYDVLPFAPYGVSAVVWYQGESNTGKGEAPLYPRLAQQMIKSWRKVFRNTKLPFIVVQIADYDHRTDEAWRAFQEAQLTIPQLTPRVTVVRSNDVCESNNIHPATKSRLAARIVDVLLNR